ncbi:hypothetical protein [Rhodoblastus sp.]|uniref:hypothetical protein n=1 Tax=Rhodoblastus sp. TaxID=1962975 RepID=UPI003F957AEF
MTHSIPSKKKLAEKLKLPETKVDFRKFSDEEKNKWLTFAFEELPKRSRVGSLAAIRPPERWTPGVRHGVWTVCYYNSADDKYDLGCHTVYADKPNQNSGRG